MMKLLHIIPLFATIYSFAAQPSSDILLRFDETEKLTFTRKDDTTALILLNGPYVFYELSLKNMSINENGLISFGKPYPNAYPTTLPDMSEHRVPYVAGFVGAIHTPSNISYVMLSEKNGDVFYESKAAILNLLREGFGGSMAGFDMTHLLAVTWESVAFEGDTTMTATFQIVLVSETGKPDTYALLLYKDIKWEGTSVLIGFNAGDRMRSFTQPANLSLLEHETNARTAGSYVYRIDGNVTQPTEGQRAEDICELSYKLSILKCNCPRGYAHTENNINCEYDPVRVSPTELLPYRHLPSRITESKIQLQGRYYFYGVLIGSMSISQYGFVSFGERFRTTRPTSLPLLSPPFIAGFWDYTQRVLHASSHIYNTELTEGKGDFKSNKALVLSLLRKGFSESMEGFDPTHILVITWDRTQHRNAVKFLSAVTFQVILVSEAGKQDTYALLLYKDIRLTWGPVLVGFNAGDGIRSFTQVFSNTTIRDLAVLTNVHRPGSLVYRIDREVTPPTNVPKLTVEFFDDTPLVFEDSVTAYIRTNREGVTLSCRILRSRNTVAEDCSSGFFSRRGLTPHTNRKYILQVEAFDPKTKESAKVRSFFRVQGDQQKQFCGVHVINAGSAPVQKQGGYVEYMGTGATTRYRCKLDGKMTSECGEVNRVVTETYQSGKRDIYRLSVANMDPGWHRFVMIPIEGCQNPDYYKKMTYIFKVIA